MRRILFVLALAAGAAASGSAWADCGPPFSESVTVSLPGRPFSVASSADGCSFFVALDGEGRRATGGIAVLHRNGNTLEAVGGISLQGQPSMLLLTKAGDLLIAAEEKDVAFIDPAKLASSADDAVLGTIGGSGMEGVINVAMTPDERTLFVSDERSATLTVIDLEKARAKGFNSDAILGQIPVGRAPVGLAVSPDGTRLYSTSEAAPPSLHLDNTCPKEGDPASSNDHAEGILAVIDIAKARSDAEHAVLGEVPAGCNAVRVVLSPSHGAAYVTARGSNAVNVFSLANLVSDPAHARTATVPTGKSPVGMALTPDGTHLYVTNSDRFGADRMAPETLNIIDTAHVADGAAAVVGTVPAGAFPRELRFTPDGVLMVTNYLSNTIQFVPVK